MKQQTKPTVRLRKPDWLKQRLPSGPDFEKIKGMISIDRLHTVCQ
jgi:lipoic acid synthetase